MRVLVGCEESGVVCHAFNRIPGVWAWSCDLLPTRLVGLVPHLQMNIMDAIEHYGPWHMIILHPPCTALAVSGNRWYGEGMPNHEDRKNAQLWTEELWSLAIHKADFVCLENPVGVLDLGVRPQYIQPWMFGHGETKKTGLWLHNLPHLVPTDIVEGRDQRIWKMPPGKNRARDRSETYDGIAKAMAEQWGNL